LSAELHAGRVVGATPRADHVELLSALGYITALAPRLVKVLLSMSRDKLVNFDYHEPSVVRPVKHLAAALASGTSALIRSAARRRMAHIDEQRLDRRRIVTHFVYKSLDWFKYSVYESTQLS
jgi:hypothetical protein